MQPTPAEDLDIREASVNSLDLDLAELDDTELASVAGGPHIVND